MALAGNPYVNLKDAYLTSMKKAQAADNALLEQKHNQEVAKANKDYDTAARDAYVTYRRSSTELPEHLSAQGITGGASETAKVNLQTAYSDALAKGNSAREGAITDLNSAYMNSLQSLANQYMKQQSDAIADYDAKIAAWDEQRQAELEAQAAAYGYGGGGGGRSYGGGSSGGSSGDYADDYSEYVDAIEPLNTKSVKPTIPNVGKIVAAAGNALGLPQKKQNNKKKGKKTKEQKIDNSPKGAISMNYVNRGFQSFAPQKKKPKRRRGKR